MATARGRRAAWLALAAILALALGLRLWGIQQGLPYAYNSDEDAHFVPRAIGIFAAGWNPHYFANPPAFTYLLHILFAAWYGGGAAVSHTFATDPTAVLTLARVAAALLGTLAVWLLYLAGARLFDRGVALLAAALQAVAFLPVFYAHLALNDVPTLAPLTLSLLGTAGVLRSGRPRWYLLAGLGLGLGCATKYTAGIVLLPLLAAAAARYLDEPRRGARVLVGLALAGIAALAAFVVANPYAVLDLHNFEQGIAHQSAVSAEAEGKLGAPHESGIVYYLWSFTWGLGWVPALAALGGALTVWWRERRLGWVLVPAPLLYLAFMGAQGRYFGRWLLPIFPLVCLLAALFALQLAAAATRLAGSRRIASVAFPALAVLALCAQGVIYSVHSGLVLARADTRNLARAWMVAHIPAGTRIVVEPLVPDEWAQDVGHPTLSTADGDRWIKWKSLVSFIDGAGALRPADQHVVGIEDYERTLSPALIPYYEREGYCWIVSGYAESGRAFADPGEVPHAVAYYRALARQAEVVYRVSPYARGARPVAFNFDWTFDYYPLAYARPGPEMTVYRLRGGNCARGAGGVVTPRSPTRR
ncbi:MAG TPA: glycosyltransferase family 39 protein [Solirubrobacteraceae bacterium]|jgi:4-amino-4-deoxy-L-arabinose transferase-like glycosyltransferase|nr:glycosyltransferase family 39 protein [Solirubrobacteraceae bacterium]